DYYCYSTDNSGNHGLF
nr:immunoglobulin light chain junction region [Macaca mulatta]MOW30346.1 immunoglobulin light chain junction region [Macaca mulatta]MOW61437.1 immunoglobulin light chain junction region [Macaca mulatta]MOX13933.1 immunoglobulin light chain junction region [Macaca mulatta]MOX33729.1 immunoglobulin light chain junction region [Macaca mulatta]